MPLSQERLGLKRLLRALIIERSIGDTTMSSIVDRMSEYEAARAEYDKWAVEQAKYEKAVALAVQRGIDPNNSAAMLRLRRQFPEHDYDPKLLKKERQVKDRLVAARKAAQPDYNADIGDLPFNEPGEEVPPPESQERGRRPQGNKPVYLSSDDMIPLHFYKWSQFESLGLPPMGGFEDGAGGSAGMHPGEERLAMIMGAERQGDNVPFDLVDQGGKAWEVKGLAKPTSLIRPGTFGVAAAREAMNRMMKVILEIEAFVDRIEEGDAATVCDSIEQMRRFVALRRFVEREKKDIERKEISASRFEAIALALENVSAMRKAWDYETMKTLKGTIGHGSKSLEVSRFKLVKMLRMLAEEDPEAQELLSTYEPRELALAELETKDAYDSPWDWMNAWDASIDVEQIFDVDGLIVVNPGGFMMVTRPMFRDVLELRSLSQDRPKYAFVPGGVKKSDS